ncbi:uncharacterized protein [Antedon mediterranea]|uniref:uncharacterized protein n=1 Tax=Antedon mediterranea TaxID=105859 RepID=UPI003AF5EFEB
MNPIWRLQHDIRRTRSDNEKKSKQQREVLRHREVKDQRREDAIDRERQRNVAGQDVANDNVNDEAEKESPAELFQRELCWCIQQLEHGLASAKPTSKQAKDAEKLVRTLKSHKAPMVKKRQVMRMTFGDYRKKMMAEKTKHEKKKSQPTLTPVASDQQSLSTFYRHASRCHPQDSEHQMETNSEVNEKKDWEKDVSLQKLEEEVEGISNDQETFKFNFEIDKNLIDNQSSPEKGKLGDEEGLINTGKRKNKGKKKKRMKDSQKGRSDKDEDKVESIKKEVKEEVKDVVEKESHESGDVERGILNLQMTGDSKPFKFNFDVTNTGEAITQE